MFNKILLSLVIAAFVILMVKLIQVEEKSNIGKSTLYIDIENENHGMAVIHWRSRDTGYAGHGSPIKYSDALLRAEQGNQRYPGIKHWIEQVLPASMVGQKKTVLKIQKPWRPKKDDAYFTPWYYKGEWSVDLNEFGRYSADKRALKAGVCFKTKKECKKFMKSKGWVNGVKTKDKPKLKFSVNGKWGAQEIMRVTPLADVEIRNNEQDLVAQIKGFYVSGNWKRPKNTKNVSVKMWTTDGKEWKAEWKEINKKKPQAVSGHINMDASGKWWYGTRNATIDCELNSSDVRKGIKNKIKNQKGTWEIHQTLY